MRETQFLPPSPDRRSFPRRERHACLHLPRAPARGCILAAPLRACGKAAKPYFTAPRDPPSQSVVVERHGDETYPVSFRSRSQACGGLHCPYSSRRPVQPQASSLLLPSIRSPTAVVLVAAMRVVVGSRMARRREPRHVECAGMRVPASSPLGSRTRCASCRAPRVFPIHSRDEASDPAAAMVGDAPPRRFLTAAAACRAARASTPRFTRRYMDEPFLRGNLLYSHLVRKGFLSQVPRALS